MFIGVNVTFFPMHFLGLAGMPRRISDYNEAYWTFNWVATIGSFVSLISMFYFIYIIFDMLYSKILRVFNEEDDENVFWTLYSDFSYEYSFIDTIVEEKN